MGLSYLWLAFNDPDNKLTLDFLSVKDNRINLPWSKRLNFKLSSPLKVKHIDFSSNPLGDKSAKEIATYFHKNKTLEVLNMSKCEIGREGLRRVKELIRSNHALKTLIVRDNVEVQDNIEMCEKRARYKEDSQNIVYY